MLTIWMSKAGPVLHEYANRDWQGMVGDYYKQRWARFFQELAGTVPSGRPPEITDWLDRGDEWSRQRNTYPSAAVGDTYTVAKAIADELAAEPS